MAWEDPIILWDNILAKKTLTASSEASGFPIENIFDWREWTYWKASSGGLITIDFDSDFETVNILAISGHNFGSGASSIGARIQIQQSTSSGFMIYDILGNYYPIDDEPFYFEFTQATKEYIRIEITDMDDPPYIAVAYMGDKMELPVGPEFSWDPDMQNTKAEKHKSYSGKVIATTVAIHQREVEVPFKRIPQSFVTSDLLPFLQTHYKEMQPFFFIPDPGDFWDDDKIYFLTPPDNPEISLPMYNDQTDFRNWTLRAKGLR